ncbi:MAG: choice-of-anchor Q domain-containing protein, partial [Planctomycetota bacterium]
GIRSWSYASVRNCAFIGNSASVLGGAVYQNAMGAIALVNCLFTGNTAGGGGAVHNRLGYVTAINCTFAGNSASFVGGMWAGYGATIRNSIFWGNSDDDGMGWTSQYNSDWNAFMTVMYNSIQGYDGRSRTNINVDPLFVDALGPDGIVGTADDDLRLSPDSPLIGAGDPAYVPAPDQTDLDGYPRLQGCRVDMGAYEAAMEQLPGDFDASGRIDLRDLAGFQLCMGVSIVRPDWLDTCLCLFDADESQDIDLHDFAEFHHLFTDCSQSSMPFVCRTNSAG